MYIEENLTLLLASIDDLKQRFSASETKLKKIVLELEDTKKQLSSVLQNEGQGISLKERKRKLSDKYREIRAKKMAKSSPSSSEKDKKDSKTSECKKKINTPCWSKPRYYHFRKHLEPKSVNISRTPAVLDSSRIHFDYKKMKIISRKCLCSKHTHTRRTEFSYHKNKSCAKIEIQRHGTTSKICSSSKSRNGEAVNKERGQPVSVASTSKGTNQCLMIRDKASTSTAAKEPSSSVGNSKGSSGGDCKIIVPTAETIICQLKSNKCDICGQTFRAEWSLRRHQLATHLDINMAKHLCSLCDRGFPYRKELKQHMAYHSRMKKAKSEACKFCPKKFSRSADLEVHERRHTGERPYVCTICKKGWIRMSELSQHVRLHHIPKLFSCAICKREFDTYKKLQLHKARRHGIPVCM